MGRGWLWLPLFLLPCLLAAAPLHGNASLLGARTDSPGLWPPPRYTFITETAGSYLSEPAGRARAYDVEPVSSSESPKTLTRGISYSTTSPGRWGKNEWLTLGFGVAGLAAVNLADRLAHEQAQRTQSDHVNHIAGQIRHFGDTYSYTSLGLSLVGGEIFDSSRARANFIDRAVATFASGLGLKYAMSRYRLLDELNPQRFQAFGGEGQSFSSGETTQAFAIASVVAARNDDLWTKAGAYGVASMLGFARIYQNGRWTSDVVAGALVGAIVGHAMVRLNDRRREQPGDYAKISIEPLSVRGGTGVRLVVTTR